LVNKMSGAEILASVPALDADIEAAKAKKSAARLAFADGAPYSEVEAARTELLRLQDLRQGRLLIAARRTHSDLSAEIDRRQAEHAALGEHVADLKRALTAAAARRHVDPEGVGAALRAALREQRESANSAFAEYEFAVNQHRRLGLELAEMITQRDAIERDNPDAFAF
jgi:hypothetical protein